MGGYTAILNLMVELLDFVQLGAVNGASTTMHLARMDAGRVLLVEKGHLAGRTSGRSGAMVREHYLYSTLGRIA